MPFADELIGPSVADALYRGVREVSPDADLTDLSEAASKLGPLTLSARASVLGDALVAGLPGDYGSFATAIRELNHRGGVTGWAVWPVTSAVTQKALDDANTAAFDDGLELLAELTGLLTSEFAIRGFLRHDLDRSLAAITQWTDSPDEYVRRLASEGTRLYLPWAVRIPELRERPGVTVPILDRLYLDPSEYVRRSVANHLNDLSRDEPLIVVDTAQRWLANPDENTPRLVRHALRTLIKKGHPGAMELLGFGPVSLAVDGPALDRHEVPFGEAVTFTASIRNIGDDAARLSVDYIVHHVKANGSLTGKTFKLTTRALEPGEVMTVERTHSFRAITTRRYYPGTHAIELQLNGIPSGRVDFELLAPPA